MSGQQATFAITVTSTCERRFRSNNRPWPRNCQAPFDNRACLRARRKRPHATRIQGWKWCRPQTLALVRFRGAHADIRLSKFAHATLSGERLDWPASIQAFGSIASLVVAVAAFWVPHKISKRALEQAAVDKIARSRIAQASLLPTLYRLRSATSDFLEEESGELSFLGVRREAESFDSNFFDLVPEVAAILALAVESGAIQKDVTELSILLFKTKEDLSSTTKLQRDGYHAAWINHKDIFIDAARALNTLSDKIIKEIEAQPSSKP